MPSEPDLVTLARKVLARTRPELWDSTWDSSGTVDKKLSHGQKSVGTAKVKSIQSDNPAVPLSHSLGHGIVGHPAKMWDRTWDSSGTVDRTSQYLDSFAALNSECPIAVEPARWQLAIQDAVSFLAKWGEQAHALGWTAHELFGLHPVPVRPAASYCRLSRYDCTGLLWLLQGRAVLALTTTTATIGTPSGGTVIYRRKDRKPALGPLGDTLDDLGACS